MSHFRRRRPRKGDDTLRHDILHVQMFVWNRRQRVGGRPLVHRFNQNPNPDSLAALLDTVEHRGGWSMREYRALTRLRAALAADAAALITLWRNNTSRFAGA